MFIKTHDNKIGCLIGKRERVITYTPIYYIDGRPYTKIIKNITGGYKYQAKICTKGYEITKHI